MATEKDMFLQSWEREFGTTMKVLKSYPKDKLELKPHAKSKSAKDLAWTFASETQVFFDGCLTGTFDFQNAPKTPATMDETLAGYEKSHKAMTEKLKNLPEAEMNSTIKFYVAKDKVADVRRGDVMWTGLMDLIHHRGQFSVYLRLADAKVPSIYGPSADEPWM